MPTREQRDYYFRRAAEVRKFASEALDPDIRATLENMAASYDKLVQESDQIEHMRTRLPVS